MIKMNVMKLKLNKLEVSYFFLSLSLSLYTCLSVLDIQPVTTPHPSFSYPIVPYTEDTEDKV